MTLLVAHIVYAFKVGGLENGLVNLINRLPRARYRHVLVVLTEADPAFSARLTRDDVQIIALHKPPGQGARLFPRVWRLLRALRPDIVHTRNLAALEMQFPAWLAGVRVRVHGEHGREGADQVGASRRHHWVRRLFRPFVTHYIALSRELEDYLRSDVGVAPVRVSRLCNGVDAERFSPQDDMPLPQGWPFGGQPCFVFGTVGRLQEVKDHVGLVRAFARLLSRCPHRRDELRLVLVGDGPLAPRIRETIAAEGVEDEVFMAGEQGAVARWLNAFDVFVMPSVSEGISNAILEAMACGLPVVATSVGGNPELVDDSVTGALVPAGDADALCDAMAAYAGSPERTRAHGRAARARIESLFSLQTMVDRYDALYVALAGPGSRSSS